MARFSPAACRIAFLLVVVACGSRTGLFVGDEDFGTDPTGDGGPDARRDASLDASDFVDAIPPLDVRPPVDVDRRDCPDADSTLIYTITETYDLQSFNPATRQFRTIGKISCPVSAGNTPFSMAVDRTGVAYVLFTDYRLYRVSTLTAACLGTTYLPQAGFQKFGMGFTTNAGGPDESLYIAGDTNGGGASGFARIAIPSFNLTKVGDFVPPIEQAELTGTGDGRLFAFYSQGAGSPPSFIGEINTSTGAVVGERRFDTVDQGRGWAFAVWGGDFYMFHAPNGRTVVTRWRPADDSVTQVATSSLKVVGAGVSTCAPQR
jgi:hypothetical protein